MKQLHRLDISSESNPTPLGKLAGKDLARFEECYLIFERFVEFFLKLLKRPHALANASCRQSHKDFFPRYYSKLFGPDITGITARHLKWMHRLRSVCELPAGSRIADIGGGYGLDSILLALFGYRVVFFEISSHHIGVCEELRRLWELQGEQLSIELVEGLPICDREDHVEVDAQAIGKVDAALCNEVAHHIEPASEVFELSRRILHNDGRLFLLEPNFWNPLVQLYFLKARGFKTVKKALHEGTGLYHDCGNENIRPFFRWCKLAGDAGFSLRNAHYIVPYFLHSASGLQSPWRRWTEAVPGPRALVASHITYEFMLDHPGGGEEADVAEGRGDPSRLASQAQGFTAAG